MKKLIVLTLLSAFLIAGLIVAQPHKNGPAFKHGNKHNGMPMILKMAVKLELTDKQTEQIEAMALEFKLEKIDLKAEIKKEKVLMKSLMRNDDASEGDVFKKIDRISKLKAENKKLQFSHRKAVESVLTDEQSDKLKVLRKNRRHNGDCGGMRGHRNFQEREHKGNDSGSDHKGNFHKG